MKIEDKEYLRLAKKIWCGDECTIQNVMRTVFLNGDRVIVNGRVGSFHRYGATRTTALVIFDEGGLSFCDEQDINYA